MDRFSPSEYACLSFRATKSTWRPKKRHDRQKEQVPLSITHLISMVHSSSVVCEFYSVNVGFSLPNFLLDAQCLPVKSDHLLRVPHPARGGAIRMKVGHRGKMRVSIARYNPLRAARPKNLRFFLFFSNSVINTFTEMKGVKSISNLVYTYL